MEDSPQSPASINLPVSSLDTGSKIQIDPKLLTKATQKMKGLIQGNGLHVDKVSLCEKEEDTKIEMFRFKARTALKLVPQYGIRVEPGRNMTAELMATEADFKKAINQIAIDARINPQRRAQIIDFMFARTDKGFGIKEQRTKFHFLNRNFVQHEKCSPCANTGHIICARCHGKSLMPCTKCQGRRHVLCPRCRGSARIETSKGNVPCQFCRGDGRVNCNLCAAKGQIRCQNCAATGSISCKTCAGSGWMSHLAHIEIFAQISFDFDREGLPPLLAQSIEKNPSQCAEKHDVEVSIIKARTTDNTLDDFGNPSNHILTNEEPEDTIWIDYEVMSPFGPISFLIDGQKKSGSLFGFQTRLLDFPYFMDDLIKNGVTALTIGSQQKKNIRNYLIKAAKYRLISDVISQTLWIKNTAKTKRFLKEKYATGLNPETISHMVDMTDLTLRNITRLWRTVGLIFGFVLFSIFLEIYFIGNGRIFIKSFGVPEIAIIIFDILCVPFGIFLGIYSSKFAAKWSQNKALNKIVPVAILKKTLPKAGKTVHWSAIISIIMTGIFLGLAVLGGGPLPDWLTLLIMRIPVASLAGL